MSVSISRNCFNYWLRSCLDIEPCSSRKFWKSRSILGVHTVLCFSVLFKVCLAERNKSYTTVGSFWRTSFGKCKPRDGHINSWDFFPVDFVVEEVEHLGDRFLPLSVVLVRCRRLQDLLVAILILIWWTVGCPLSSKFATRYLWFNQPWVNIRGHCQYGARFDCRGLVVRDMSMPMLFEQRHVVINFSVVILFCRFFRAFAWTILLLWVYLHLWWFYQRICHCGDPQLISQQCSLFECI